MTEDQLKEVVRSYILNTIEDDAADSLYEFSEFQQLQEEEFEREIEKAYELFESAKVTVGWDL